MRIVILALIFGALTEGAFATMAFTSSWGPCGPGTLLGLVGMLAHVPGLIPMMAYQTVLGPDAPGSGSLLVGSPLLFWAAGFWCLLTLRAKHRGL